MKKYLYFFCFDVSGMKKFFIYLQLIFIGSFYITYNILGVIILAIIRTVLFPFPALKNEGTLIIKRKWLDLTSTLVGLYFHKPIYVAYNKEILKNKRSIIISNHITNYDWIFLMLVLRELDKYDELRIILKESLAKIPIFGYGMKCFKFIFLKRNWSEDKNKLREGIGNLKDKLKYNVLIFPEGTFIDSETHKKSKTFSTTLSHKINNKTFNPEYTLIPRTRGLGLLYNELKNRSDGVIDTTLLYTPFYKYPSEIFTTKELLEKKLLSTQIFIILDSLKLESDDEKWIYNQFHRKNNIIKKFSENVEEFSKVNTLEHLSYNIYNITDQSYNFKKIELWSNSSYAYISIYISFKIILLYGILAYFNKI
ncbi:1-acyl-sn-glycerol-3-phosphate acyltransferase [Spraguea lophii 42_110]|uniref:1-acyl-sn-glycerol-3-phosphate acyltransferase n=1 Tax=Spraguea lophii (strain 42_110) TaxID=1358809 RepID=S7XTD3_SPRLO|nr:1-acyl-sn-glycerol-3-phosphate acyltransferase [Spraguea lophii 42_110]